MGAGWVCWTSSTRWVRAATLSSHMIPRRRSARPQQTIRPGATSAGHHKRAVLVLCGKGQGQDSQQIDVSVTVTLPSANNKWCFHD
jgi:hypothetical protein